MKGSDMQERSSERKKIEGKGLPLHGNDIDTDRIIPARYLRCVTFEELGQYAFYDERYTADGGRTEHPFNEKRFEGHDILIVNKNFGCGSSREHAPQSLMRMGIRAIIGESFAEIFAGNCTALGIPAVKAESEDIGRLMDLVETEPDTAVVIDLENGRIRAGGLEFGLTMPLAARKSLLSGEWDTTSVLLEGSDAITETSERLPYLHGYAAI